MRSDIAHVHNLSIEPIEEAEAPEWFDDDSEWEYEYDENETEDFFFTLDLTTHLPDALNKRMAARNGRWARGTMEARTKKIRGKKPASKPSDDPAAIFVEQGEVPNMEALRASNVTKANEVEDNSEPAGTLQLLGLHTASPYVVYNNVFYSAYWITNVGTQLWISRPGISQSTIFKGHVLDIIGASQVRLLARPAKLRKRHRAYTQPPVERTSPPPPDVSNHFIIESTERTEKAKGPISIPRGDIFDPALMKHAHFMEELSAMKWKQGETDQMPLNSVRQYGSPDRETQDQDLASQTTSPRKPRRRKRARAETIDSDGDDDIHRAVEDEEFEGMLTSSQAKTARKVKDISLISMGLLDPDAAPVPKRRRRTKAQIAADKAAEQAKIAADAAAEQA